MFRGEADDQLAMQKRENCCCHDKSAIRFGSQRQYSSLDLGRVTDRSLQRLERKTPGCIFEGLLETPVVVIIGVAKHSDTRYARGNFSEPLQPFARNGIFEWRKSGHIATRMREAGHEPSSNGVGHVDENNRDRLCRLVERSCFQSSEAGSYLV